MSKDWPVVKFSSFLTLACDAVPVDPAVSYPFVGLSGFGNGLFKRSSLRGSETTYSHFHRLCRDQLVLSQPKGWEGAITVVSEEFEGLFLSKVFPTFKIDRSIADPGFVRILTKCSWLWKQLFELSSGIGARRNATYPEHLLAAETPLPPLDEQKRIVARLDAIEIRLNRAQKLRAEAAKERRALLSSAFLQLSRNCNYLPLSEIAPLTKRQIEIDLDESYREYGIRSFYNGIFLRRIQAGAEYDWQKLFLLREGDLVFSNIMAWEKSIGLATKEQDGWVGNHRMLTCEPDRTKALPEWIYQYFKTSEGFAKIVAASPGTVARNKTLRAARLMEITVPIPSLEIQKQFSNIVKKEISCSASSDKSEAYFEGVLPSALNKVFNR